MLNIQWGNNMKTNKIPIIFAVTGHRDICTEAIPQIKKILKDTFTLFQKEHPHTPAVLISALAEGADMLVAEIAIECGIELHAMLPYQEKEYLKSFGKPENIEKFNELKSKATKVETVSDIEKHSHEEAYEILGKKLADLSTILIALWDGKDNGKKGGTSEVVKYKKKNLVDNQKDRHEGTAIYIINTPRESSDCNKKTIGLKKHYIGPYINENEFEKILKNIDRLNKEMEKSKESPLTYLHSIMKFFERKASINQKRFKLYSKLILLASLISIISLETFHDFGIDITLIFYGIGIIIAFFVYYFLIKKGDVQNDFIYSRGFVEALRIQNAWNATDIDACVSDYYLINQHHKYVWMRIALRNIVYMDKTPFNPLDTNTRFIPEFWINEQIEYYKNAIIIRENRYGFWKGIENIFYKSGLIFLILMFVYYFVQKLFHVHVHHLLHILIFASGVSLLIAVFIGEKYNKLEGFEEEIYNFGTMYNLFKDTKEALVNVSETDDAYRNTIRDLGIAALDENTKWIVTHDTHRAKPILE